MPESSKASSMSSTGIPVRRAISSSPISVMVTLPPTSCPAPALIMSSNTGTPVDTPVSTIIPPGIL